MRGVQDREEEISERSFMYKVQNLRILAMILLSPYLNQLLAACPLLLL